MIIQKNKYKYLSLCNNYQTEKKYKKIQCQSINCQTKSLLMKYSLI